MVIRSKPIKKVNKPVEEKKTVKPVEKKQPKKNSLLDLIEEEETKIEE